MKTEWKNYWKDDEFDQTKHHLSQNDKRSLLYGGFMIGLLITLIFSIVTCISTLRTDHQYNQEAKKILDTVTTYMATATEDEYAEIAQSIRHDLVYSEYSSDIDYYLQYIPNTADECCLEQSSYPQRLNLVFLNTGELYGLDPSETSNNAGSTTTTFGYDEISEAHLSIIKRPGETNNEVSIDRGRGIVSFHKMKSEFCDNCIQNILTAIKDSLIIQAVIYDAEEKAFYPLEEGTLQIGDYSLETTYANSGYKIKVQRINNN